MNFKNQTIWIKTQREFVHNFPEAATIPELCAGDEWDVSFLAHPHRHEFGFFVESEVFHDDRDLELIQVKRSVEKYLDSLPRDLGRMSCEQFAKNIITHMVSVWGEGRFWRVSVDEDGFVGATVELDG